MKVVEVVKVVDAELVFLSDSGKSPGKGKNGNNDAKMCVWLCAGEFLTATKLGEGGRGGGVGLGSGSRVEERLVEKKVVIIFHGELEKTRTAAPPWVLNFYQKRVGSLHISTRNEHFSLIF